MVLIFLISFRSSETVALVKLHQIHPVSKEGSGNGWLNAGLFVPHVL
jgi:hypothetical protein